MAARSFATAAVMQRTPLALRMTTRKEKHRHFRFDRATQYSIPPKENPMLKLYGTSMSRAARCLWALEELKLKYEHVPVGFDGGTREPDYMNLNPDGRVP